MIPNINPELINQDILANRIESLEAGYIDSLIASIQGPQFILSCENDLNKEDITPERKKALVETIEKNKASLNSHSESIGQLNIIIAEARTYVTK